MFGIVLAGGESRRMGSDKALMVIDGLPLWKRQVAVLLNAGAGRVVVVRRAGQEPIDHPDCALDIHPGLGPLAGIHAGLALCPDRLAAVLAVDMPGIDAGWFQWLSGQCKGGGAAGSLDGRVEPLAAIYPADSLADATVRIERGDLSVAALANSLAAAGRMEITPVPPAYRGRLASLNEPVSPSAPRGGCS